MSKLIRVPMIQSMIIELREERVILDSDLAMLYQVPTKVLNQAVKRNKKRFPSDFMFQLTKEEYNFLKSQIVTSERIPEKKRKLSHEPIHLQYSFALSSSHAMTVSIFFEDSIFFARAPM